MNCVDRGTGTGLPSVTLMVCSFTDSRRRARWPRVHRRMLALLLLAVCAIPLASRAQKTQRHERRHEIDHLEEVWRNAMLKDDTAAMSSLLADDYMAITPSGTLQTKAEALANLQHVHFATLEVSDRKVRFYGTTALVTSLAEVQATTPEGDVSGSYRYTRVYVEGPPGVWKIVSFEASRILAPGEHKQAAPSPVQ